MKGAKITLPNGKKFALVARSGSYSIIWQALPENLRNPVGDRWHPINATTHTIGSPLNSDDISDLCCLVRDPVERFRSACARQQKTVEEGLESISFDVHFWTLESMGLLAEGVLHFRFPEQIDTCAQWLGLEAPVPQLNEEVEELKPVLTPEQEAAIRTLYATDIALWESLQQ
jgi:hypothetical protein